MKLRTFFFMGYVMAQPFIGFGTGYVLGERAERMKEAAAPRVRLSLRSEEPYQSPDDLSTPGATWAAHASRQEVTR